MRRLTLAFGGVLAAAAATLGSTAPAAAQETASVYVVHGIPDTPVDVYVDGARLLDGFQPGSAAGPVNLPRGAHEVALFPADAADGSGPPLLSATQEVPGGGNVTLVAHLTEGGQPAVTPFANDVSSVPAGQARVVVRHTAAAPAVDVRAGGTPVFEGLTNPNEDSADVDAGDVSADVVLAGTDTVAIGPADLNLGEGTSTIVYAWGSAADENLELAVQTIDGLHSAPGGVPSGSGGLLGDGLPLPLLGLALLGAAGAVVGTRRLAASRA